MPPLPALAGALPPSLTPQGLCGMGQPPPGSPRPSQRSLQMCLPYPPHSECLLSSPSGRDKAQGREETDLARVQGLASHRKGPAECPSVAF